MLVVLLALSQSWLSYAGVGSGSHGAVPAVEAGAHGHDDPESRGRSTHPHPHDAADHSHDKPNLPRNDAHVPAGSAGAWCAAPCASFHPPPSFAFERPPRALSVN